MLLVAVLHAESLKLELEMGQCNRAIYGREYKYQRIVQGIMLRQHHEAYIGVSAALTLVTPTWRKASKTLTQPLFPRSKSKSGRIFYLVRPPQAGQQNLT